MANAFKKREFKLNGLRGQSAAKGLTGTPSAAGSATSGGGNVAARMIQNAAIEDAAGEAPESGETDILTEAGESILTEAGEALTTE